MNRRQFVATAGFGLAAPWLAGCVKKVGVRAKTVAPGLTEDVEGSRSLKTHAAAHGVLYGCAVNVAVLGRDEAYKRLITQQAAILVAENEMKFGPMRPSPTEFRFGPADELLAFADANQMKMRGHNLCWHRQLPPWFTSYVTKENAEQILVTHIQTVMSHYRGRLQSWDVVNEAVHPPDARADGLRDSPWMKLLGPGYLETAYRAARKADPSAKLTYNDYGIEGEDEASAKKRAAVLDLVRSLQAKGLIDAVGIQSHISASTAYGQGIADFISTVAKLNLEIYVTEMDVNDRKLGPDNTLRDQEVANSYRKYLTLLLKEPAVKAVLTWGITDEFTWLNGEDAREDHLPERCLPFDKDLKPVPAYFAVRDAFDTAEGSALR